METRSSISTGRVIVHIEGDVQGPVLVAVAGIHGNEPSGVQAMQKIAQNLSQANLEFSGTFIGLAGNVKALQIGQRFLAMDLNRIWKPEYFNIDPNSQGNGNPEIAELRELRDVINSLLLKHSGPFYFIDLHTTSAKSIPFIPFSDTIMNRSFASDFGVPMILGIEEHIRMPMMTWINDLGYVALGFEAGSHLDPSSILMHESFVYLALMKSGIISAADFKDAELHRKRLSNSNDSRKSVFEIRSRFGIEDANSFEMLPGYVNFQAIRKGEHLANYQGRKIVAEETGMIFMPLYQPSGDDGFFIIRKINPFWLKVSEVLRRLRAESLLPLLPGISRDPLAPHILRVNLKVAKFYARQIFHLLGFRVTHNRKNMICFERRKFDFKGPEKLPH